MLNTATISTSPYAMPTNKVPKIRRNVPVGILREAVASVSVTDTEEGLSRKEELIAKFDDKSITMTEQEELSAIFKEEEGEDQTQYFADKMVQIMVDQGVPEEDARQMADGMSFDNLLDTDGQTVSINPEVVQTAEGPMFVPGKNDDNHDNDSGIVETTSEDVFPSPDAIHVEAAAVVDLSHQPANPIIGQGLKEALEEVEKSKKNS